MLNSKQKKILGDYIISQFPGIGLENICKKNGIDYKQAKDFINTLFPDDENIELSVVIPVYNEQGNIQPLIGRLEKSISGIVKSSEIIFVDDGSQDDTIRQIKTVQKKYANIRLLKLSRNFGQHSASQAGFDHARGDAIVWMDADLQEPPEEIPKLFLKLKEGYDLVYGLRKEVGGSLFKRIASLFFVWVFNKIASNSLPLNACTMRVMSRRFVQSINRMPERVRFLAGINSWVGFKRIGVEIKYMPRESGETKYNFPKMLKMSVDGLLSFSMFPLRLITLFGFIVAGLSFVDMTHIILKRFFGITGGFTLGWAPIMVSIYFLGGVQCIFLGLIGEYLGRIYMEVKSRPLYIIEEQY